MQIKYHDRFFISMTHVPGKSYLRGWMILMLHTLNVVEFRYTSFFIVWEPLTAIRQLEPFVQFFTKQIREMTVLEITSTQTVSSPQLKFNALGVFQFAHMADVSPKRYKSESRLYTYCTRHCLLSNNWNALEQREYAIPANKPERSLWTGNSEASCHLQWRLVMG